MPACRTWVCQTRPSGPGFCGEAARCSCPGGCFCSAALPTDCSARYHCRCRVLCLQAFGCTEAACIRRAAAVVHHRLLQYHCPTAACWTCPGASCSGMLGRQCSGQSCWERPSLVYSSVFMHVVLFCTCTVLLWRLRWPHLACQSPLGACASAASHNLARMCCGAPGSRVTLWLMPLHQSVGFLLTAGCVWVRQAGATIVDVLPPQASCFGVCGS